METIEKDGLVLKISDDGIASAELWNESDAETVTVPSEINGIPVREFSFFRRKAINNIRLPESVNKLTFTHKFEHSINIEIDEKNPYFFADGKAVYSKDRSELVSFLALGDEEYTVLDGCERIARDAFANAKKLKRVIFPEGLKVIEFSAFYDCWRLEELTLPEGLTEICEFAFFACSDLKNITLPSTLETVRNAAFKDCSLGLTVNLPKALKEIAPEAFPRDWTLILSEENKDLVSVGDLILSGDGRKVICPAGPIKTDVLTVPDSVAEIAPYAFRRNDKLEKVILPKGLHTIGSSAFAGMENLKEINLENVREIGDNAFRWCGELKKVSLKCDKLEACAFFDCKSLTEADVDCEIIREAAFQNCGSLQKVVLKNTRVIGKEAFRDTKALKDIVLPYGLEEIGDHAFAGSGIKVLTVPKTVRRMDRNIADGIEEIHIYDNIETDIGKDNDISESSYILYVHSAQTDEIKYVVSIIGPVKINRLKANTHHMELVKMFNKGADLDLKKYDSYLIGFSGEQFAFERFNAMKLRLKYGYELDSETRRGYEEQLGKITPYVMEVRIEAERTQELFDPEFYEYLNVEQMLPLIDLSARYHLTELTAFLMQLCNDKRNGKLKN